MSETATQLNRVSCCLPATSVPTPAQSEFVVEGFDTSVTEETTTQLAQGDRGDPSFISGAIDDNDLIEDLLRNSSMSFGRLISSTNIQNYTLSRFSLSRYSTR